MSEEQPRLPPTPRSCSSPVRMGKTGSGSSRNSDSPVHWETIMGPNSQKNNEIRPSSWDNSDDELPLTLERDTLQGHIYSSGFHSNRKSVAAEINELKQQFFKLTVLETETEIEDLREKLESTLRHDRRQSPARVRRRTKSSSSSSTAVDAAVQGSPRQEDELIQTETIFDNIENIAPILELESKFYLDNFFAELRRKRISMLEPTIGIAHERDEDFEEIAIEDPDDLMNLSDGGYYNRTSRKLSQILEVEENKRESDKDVEEYSENNDLFLQFSKKSRNSDYSPLQTARSKKDEKSLENMKNNEYKFKSSSVELQNANKVKQTRECLSERHHKDIVSKLGNDVISLTAKTGTTHLNSSKWKDVKESKADLHHINNDDDVNWNLIKSLKLDLTNPSENPTPRNSSRHERNSRTGSRRSTRGECLKSPKFIINVGKESGRSLQVEDIKTPKSARKNLTDESDRSVKDHRNSCVLTVQEAENILIDLKSPSLESRMSNRSSELQDILFDQGVNTNRYTQRSEYTNEARDQGKASSRSEFSTKRIEHSVGNPSETSYRSINSKSSRSSRSYRLSSRANESRASSQRSDTAESLEREESRRSSSISPRTELELLRQTNIPRLEKPCNSSPKSPESAKSTPRGVQTTTPTTSCSYNEDIVVEPKIRLESFDNNEGILTPDVSAWVELDKIQTISSNRLEKSLKSQRSSRSEIINSESLDKATCDDSVEELRQSSRNSSRKSVIVDNLDNLDNMSSSRSMKNRSRINSCTSEERTLLNIPLNTERSEEVKTSGRTTDRSGIIEESENLATQRLKNDSESDRRLSVINEVSFEDIKLSNNAENPKKSIPSSAVSSEGTNTKRTPKSHSLSQRSTKDQPLMNEHKPEGLWKDLIETFSEDKNQPFNWQDNFLGFLNPNQKSSISAAREPSSPTAENIRFLKYESGRKEPEGFMLSGALTENILRFPQKREKILCAEKRQEKVEDFNKNLDLDTENNLMEKMKNDNETQNLYYFEVAKTGNFGIGEFGDVTCWSLGVSHALEEGKPKGYGDGIIPQCHKETPILKSDDRENESKIQKQLWMNLNNDFRNSNSKIQKCFQTNYDLDQTPYFQNDLKTSKSDNCINTIEFSQYSTVDFCSEKSIKLKSEAKHSVFENLGKRERKPGSFISSVQYSSSECISDETDNQESDFEKVRRSASLTDITAEIRKSGYEKLESNESLYNSRSRLFEKLGKHAEKKDTTNLNIFLANKNQEDKTKTKSKWLIVKQSRGTTCHRENKKNKSRLKIDKRLIKKDSKEYLSFRSRHSIPELKFRNSNCFQNFYKRIISVFCLTSNSSLPTSK